MVPQHAPRVYATIATHVSAETAVNVGLGCFSPASSSCWMQGGSHHSSLPALIVHRRIRTKPHRAEVCCRLPGQWVTASRGAERLYEDASARPMQEVLNGPLLHGCSLSPSCHIFHFCSFPNIVLGNAVA